MSEPPKPSKPDLLAYALFDMDPRVKQFQQPLLTFLVSVALFELDRPANLKDILEACEDQFLSNDGVVLGEIAEVVKVAKNAGLLVEAGSDTVELSTERRKQLAGIAKLIDGLRDAFHHEIAASVEHEMGSDLSKDAAIELRKALEGFIQRLFQQQSVVLARAFGPDGGGFDSATADLFSMSSLNSIAKSVAGQHEQLRKAQVAEGIRKALFDLDAPGQRYLATVYQKTIAAALLKQDPSIRRLKRQLAQERIFYLDTNVVIALMFSAHPKHESVRAAVEAARDVGCALLISPSTLEELAVQIDEANEAYEQFKATTNRFSIVSDDILRSYGVKLEENPELSWRAFMASHTPPVEALEELGIELSDIDAPFARHDVRRERVLEVLNHFKPESHRKVLDCDADNLLLVQIRRKKLPTDEMGSRVWFVTLDRNLRDVERRLIAQAVYGTPSSKQVDGWAAGLSPHLSPDDENLGEYVLHMVQSNLGLVAEDPIFADVNFLVTLEKKGRLDVDELLAASPARTRRVLVALQEEIEIEEILEEEPEKPEERDVWAKRLSEVVKETLAKLDETSRKVAVLDEVKNERDRFQTEIASIKRDRNRSWRRISELERQMSRNGPRDSIFARLRKRLPL